MRKKCLIGLVCAVVFCSGTWSSAKLIPAGAIEVGGSTAVDLSKDEIEAEGGDEQEISTFSVSGDMAYYVVDNFGVGIDVLYEKQKSEVDNYEATTTTTIIGPMGIYNINVSDPVSIYLMGEIGFAKMEFDDNDDNEFDLDGFAWGVGGGVRYFPVNNVSLDVSISYIELQLEEDRYNTDIDQSNLNVGFGISIFFGM